ncbi:MAG: GumC family protein [Armatimonadota bacterium]
MGGSGVEFRQYFRAVTKRLWLVVLLAALAAGGVYMRVTSQPPKYSADATLMVTGSVFNPPISSVPGSQSGGAVSRQPAAVFNDIIQLITARPVSERVARELGLAGPGDARQGVTATQVRATDLIKIRAVHSDREMAPRLANTTADQLIAHFREVNRRDMRDVRLYIEKQLAQARARLVDSDRSIQAYKERHRIVDMTVTRSEATQEAAAARMERDTTALTLTEIEAKIAASRARLANEKLERVTARVTRDNPVFTQLQSRLTSLEIQRAEISQVYTPEHPKSKQIEGELANVRQQMLAQAKTVLSDETVGSNPVHDQLLTSVVTLEVDRAASTAKLNALTFLQRQRQGGLVSLPGLETGLTMLTRENKILDGNYSLLSERYQEALLRENEAGFIPAGVQVMETAVVPTAPVSARLPVQTGIAALVGLLLGVMGAIFLDSSEDRIRTAQDAERTLGVPVLAAVPDMTTPRVAPAGAALLVALVLMMVAGGSVVAARTLGDGTADARSPVSMLAQLGRGIDHLTSRLGEAIR